ncbi:alpha-ketoglutarate-dependent dioxygenase alkB homolog 7, mitochondrial isoform X2 [Leptinotarsa decemlineata]|uniref:alpha-ketoglutarate-dependent dioxygenase alkB homolog 7, mitochondrial isoform X2 n=1 Tax=Leptinotarsa decemlineata TaxID=7539 RepID=UPI000C254526|nr:alpha-ketoglutarate-dependent dioxygenase alkB homolog 7, mitochondrial isoform X2 [Leptinotarsa decemlineata]
MKAEECASHGSLAFSDQSRISPSTKILETIPNYLSLSQDFIDNPERALELVSGMTVHKDFLSEDEEKSILNEIEPYMKRLRYEFDHWDDAIHGYRETERLNWNDDNTKIINRVRSIAFPPHAAQLKYVHILDLDRNGYIKPHIDAVRFCGTTIAGLSLLSDSVMRLVHDKQKNLFADVLLQRRSLYIMKNIARFDYTHEILKNENSIFKGEQIYKDRRISVICRNEPDPNNQSI